MSLEIKELAQEFSKARDEVKAIAEEIIGKQNNNETITRDLKEQADNLLTTFNELKAQTDDLEQKMARRAVEAEPRSKSVGQSFIESEKWKAFHESKANNGTVSFDVKTITTGDTSGGAFAQPTVVPGVIQVPEQKLVVRDLISPGRTDNSHIEYVRETGFTNNAATVAEGAEKPESNIEYERISTSTKVIAHWINASRQVLSDESMLKSYINERLLQGLAFVEDRQLLLGDGTGENLLGIVPQASAYTVPSGVTPATQIDTLRLAMLQAVLAEYPATGHVLNPTDWAAIDMLKTDSGEYVVGNPRAGTVNPTLWGLPVVETQAISQGKFLTGAFKLGAQLYDQWQSRVEVSTENKDNFIKNMVTILAEERLALAVYRPEAFIYGDIAPATTP